MKTTSTIMYMLKSELINAGKNEFYGKDQLRFFDDDYSFIQKALKYDDDIAKITNRMFFHGFKLDDDKADKVFKQAFITRFLNRQIAFQTVEVFAGRLMSYCFNQQVYMNEIYAKLADFINDKAESTTKSVNDDTRTTDNRALYSDLPQDQINLNVDDTVLNYGNENDISRQKQEGNATGTTTTNNSKADIDSLAKANMLAENIMNDIDRLCFLQIW